MSRGVSSGGGKSSLDYLFESDQKLLLIKGTRKSTPPPFALDSDGKGRDNEMQTTAVGATPSSGSRDQEQKLGKVSRGRPSVKIHSVPGGSSSLGYLFGDK
ncbi:spiral1 [Rhynchospora pubera]|uniref:Spiral1 n=1 Tax=Rhynchospora pubera TaxID=906938 RepID=A0AAV8E3P3_9POAL|nr:spiral1 [Rhynchospora pubera]KAJ4777940.1 spiral1 [Rhynchospora pubera]KAJ4784804.1 spiral1 [Rhynchospora pubera]